MRPAGPSSSRMAFRGSQIGPLVVRMRMSRGPRGPDLLTWREGGAREVVPGGVLSRASEGPAAVVAPDESAPLMLNLLSLLAWGRERRGGVKRGSGLEKVGNGEGRREVGWHQERVEEMRGSLKSWEKLGETRQKRR